jgi:hypothetical protein
MEVEDRQGERSSSYFLCHLDHGNFGAASQPQVSLAVITEAEGILSCASQL